MRYLVAAMISFACIGVAVAQDVGGNFNSQVTNNSTFPTQPIVDPLYASCQNPARFAGLSCPGAGGGQ